MILYDVYVSYSDEDKMIAEEICRYLEGKGIRCYVPHRDVVQKEIIEGPNLAQMVVVILQQTIENFDKVEGEIVEASFNDQPILVFRFNGELGYDRLGVKYSDAAFEKLYKNIHKLIRPISEDAEVQNKIGDYYSKGIGVEQSYDEAAKWYSMASMLDNPEAQASLGWCYLTGKGVEQSYDEAVKWARKSVALSQETSAWTLLGICYYYGYGVEQSYDKSVDCFSIADELCVDGDKNMAQCFLGICYLNGQGVVQSYEEAEKRLREAEKNGNDLAKQLLDVKEKWTSMGSLMINIFK